MKQNLILLLGRRLNHTKESKDCDNANENGYCNVSACNNPNLLRNLVPSNAEPDWSKIHYNNPWHTGTPTEEGWYLYEYGITGGSYATFRADTKEELAYLGGVKRWQKIEP